MNPHYSSIIQWINQSIVQIVQPLFTYRHKSLGQSIHGEELEEALQKAAEYGCQLSAQVQDGRLAMGRLRGQRWPF